MPKFEINTNFQFYGIIRRSGSVMEVSEEILQHELDLGKKANGKPLSGLLNHCTPADKETERLAGNIKPVSMVDGPTEEEIESRISEIKEQMDTIGKSYDKRWGLKRFEEELKKARIITGE